MYEDCFDGKWWCAVIIGGFPPPSGGGIVSFPPHEKIDGGGISTQQAKSWGGNRILHPPSWGGNRNLKNVSPPIMGGAFRQLGGGNEILGGETKFWPKNVIFGRFRPKIADFWAKTPKNDVFRPFSWGGGNAPKIGFPPHLEGGISDTFDSPPHLTNPWGGDFFSAPGGEIVGGDFFSFPPHLA